MVPCSKGPEKFKLGLRGYGHIKCSDAEQNMAVEVHEEMPSQISASQWWRGWGWGKIGKDGRLRGL